MGNGKGRGFPRARLRRELIAALNRVNGVFAFTYSEYRTSKQCPTFSHLRHGERADRVHPNVRDEFPKTESGATSRVVVPNSYKLLKCNDCGIVAHRDTSAALSIGTAFLFEALEGHRPGIYCPKSIT